MNTPEKTTPASSTASPQSATHRIARVLWIGIAIVVALAVLGMFLGKKQEGPEANSPQYQPPSAPPASSSASVTSATKPANFPAQTTQQEIAAAEAEIARREKHVEQLVAALWRKVDANGEGMETKGEITLIVRNLQNGQEEIALGVLERSTKFRVKMLRKEFIEIRDAQRLVAAANEERGVLLRKRLDEKREEAEAERAAQSRAVGAQVPSATPVPAPTTPAP